MPNKKLIMVITIVAGLFFVGAIVYALAKDDSGNKDNAADTSAYMPSSSLQQTINTIINGYDITGVWYSDRDDGDRIEIDNTGNYISTNWLVDGRYSIEGNTITLSSKLDGPKEFVLNKNGDIYTLIYDNDYFRHIYYRTEEEAEYAISERERLEPEKQALIESAFSQILTTGEWVSEDGQATLNFTDTHYTIAYTWPDGEDEVSEHGYSIEKVEETLNGYSVDFTISTEAMSDIGDGIASNRAKLSLEVDGDNYTINSFSFEFYKQFHKNVYIEFE